jgi:HlyD family secretion protein
MMRASTSMRDRIIHMEDGRRARSKAGQGNRMRNPSPKPKQPRSSIFSLAIATSWPGVLAGLVAAYIFGIERKAQPPVFKPVSSPYDSAIYANGIIESDQSSGQTSTSIPKFPVPITKVLVREGQQVSAGAPLFTIDDSVQKATTEQLRRRPKPPWRCWNELKAEPRKETLAIAVSQVGWPNPT